MPKASELLKEGEWNYVSVEINRDGTHNITLITKSGKVAKLKCKLSKMGLLEVLEDMEVKE